MKAYTDVEQSKKLAEILSNKTSDMYYWCGEDIRFGGYKAQDKDYDVPCWSLAALLNLLPSEFTQKGKYSTTTYKIDIRKYKFTDDVDLHQIAYGSIKIDVDGQFSFKDMVNTGEKENLVDACYEMVTILKEKNLI